jgi:hypothetical protein
VFDGADLAKADLTGAHPQGSSLFSVKLQDAALDYAQLQGAYAQLQGASLGGGEQLQRGLRLFAKLQGESLLGAQLQRGLRELAQLPGASLFGAQLQGAYLDLAQLQGAWLLGAQVRAADFHAALLWRTQLGIDPARFGPVHYSDKNKDAAWKPVWRPVNSDPDSKPLPWDAKAYVALRNSMNIIPEGQFRVREAALKRIETLDCSAKVLGSCNPAAKLPPAVLDWQNQFARANIEDAAYAKALATELQNLVCANDMNAIHILRGLSSEYLGAPRLTALGREAPALVDFIMSKGCLVSAALTEDDKAKLLKIKQDAEK